MIFLKTQTIFSTDLKMGRAKKTAEEKELDILRAKEKTLKIAAELNEARARVKALEAQTRSDVKNDTKNDMIEPDKDKVEVNEEEEGKKKV